MAYNDGQESKQVTPTELQHGFHRKPPGDIKIMDDTTPAARDFLSKKKSSLSKAVQCLKVAHERQQASTNRNRREISFQQGDSVMLCTDHNPLASELTCKFASQFTRHFRVIARVGTVAYKLDLPTEVKIHLEFHILQRKAFNDLDEVFIGRH